MFHGAQQSDSCSFCYSARTHTLPQAMGGKSLEMTTMETQCVCVCVGSTTVALMAVKFLRYVASKHS